MKNHLIAHWVIRLSLGLFFAQVQAQEAPEFWETYRTIPHYTLSFQNGLGLVNKKVIHGPDQTQLAPTWYTGLQGGKKVFLEDGWYRHAKLGLLYTSSRNDFKNVVSTNGFPQPNPNGRHRKGQAFYHFEQRFGRAWYKADRFAQAEVGLGLNFPFTDYNNSKGFSKYAYTGRTWGTWVCGELGLGKIGRYGNSVILGLNVNLPLLQGS